MRRCSFTRLLLHVSLWNWNITNLNWNFKVPLIWIFERPFMHIYALSTFHRDLFGISTDLNRHIFESIFITGSRFIVTSLWSIPRAYSRFSNVCFLNSSRVARPAGGNTPASPSTTWSPALYCSTSSGECPWSIVIRLINSYRGCLWLFWAWEKQRFHSIALLSFIAAGLFPPQCFHGGSDVR